MFLHGRYRKIPHNQDVDADQYLANAALSFVQRTTEHIRGAENIRHIQVENEPLVPIIFVGVGGKYISEGFVRKEMAIVNEVKREDQHTLLTLTVLPLPIPLPGFSDENQLKVSIELADDVGLNVYNRFALGSIEPFVNIPWVRLKYIRPLPIYFAQKLAHWNERLKQAGKGAWVVESQAEPWEPKGVLDRVEFPSANPRLTRKLAQTLIRTGYSPILFWGSEYWYWQRLHNGNNTWWKEMGKLMDDARGKY